MGREPEAGEEPARRRVTGGIVAALVVVAGVVIVGVVIAGVALLGGGGDGSRAGAPTSTSSRARAVVTTTTTTGPPPDSTTTLPVTGPAAGGTGAADPEPPPTTVPLAQGVVVVETPGACRYDPATGVLLHAGTVTNRTGDRAFVQVTVSFVDQTGAELDFWTDVFDLEQGQTAPWSARGDWTPDPPDPDDPGAVVPHFARCVVTFN